MSLLSILAQSSKLFLVTAVYPDVGEVRLSCPLFNPLYGLQKGQRRVVSWRHLHISGAARPGQIVELLLEKGAPRIFRTFLSEG